MSVVNALVEIFQSSGFVSLSWQNWVMILVSFVLLYLAIVKKFEPLLLVPIAFGMLLVNIYPDIMYDPLMMSSYSGQVVEGAHCCSGILLYGSYTADSAPYYEAFNYQKRARNQDGSA